MLLNFLAQARRPRQSRQFVMTDAFRPIDLCQGGGLIAGLFPCQARGIVNRRDSRVIITTISKPNSILMRRRWQRFATTRFCTTAESRAMRHVMRMAEAVWFAIDHQFGIALRPALDSLLRWEPVFRRPSWPNNADSSLALAASTANSADAAAFRPRLQPCRRRAGRALRQRSSSRIRERNSSVAVQTAEPERN
jgi:hypothetical protein